MRFNVKPASQRLYTLLIIIAFYVYKNFSRWEYIYKIYLWMQLLKNQMAL